MIEFKKIFEHRNRGILLDVVVFIVNLILIRLLARLSTNLVKEAETNVSAEIAVGLFFAGLLFLQSLVPILKRWSFHQRDKSFDTDKPQNKLAGAFLYIYQFFYFAILVIVAMAAVSLLLDAAGIHLSDGMGLFALGALALAAVDTKIMLNYFRPPMKEPHWKFLITPRAEMLGDICLFLNVICFQIVWCVYTESAQFWEQFYSVTHIKSGNSLTAVMERLWIFTVIALLIYFPPRIFYLVIDQHRKTTWLTMLLANLPVVLGVIFFSPAALDTPRVEINLFSSPKQQISNNPSFTLTAEDFYNEYKLDPKATPKKYANKYVNVIGRISEIEMNYGRSIGPVVRLDGGGNAQWVTCHFDANQRGTIKMLAENQRVTLQGVGEVYWFGSPTLNHCVIVSAQ